jgi:formate dehydrogenase assembly factor FdhD
MSHDHQQTDMSADFALQNPVAAMSMRHSPHHGMQQQQHMQQQQQYHAMSHVAQQQQQYRLTGGMHDQSGLQMFTTQG